MKRKRQIRPEALIELREAAEWYEEQRDGLGTQLLEEFEHTLEEALGRLETSVAIAKTSQGLPIRRFRLRRFARHAIYLVVLDETPVVVAFEHSSREPGYWRNRVK